MNSIASLGNLHPKQLLATLLAEKQRREALRKERELRRKEAQLPVSSLNSPPVLSRDIESSLVLRPESPFSDLLKPSRYKVYYGGRGAAKSWAFAEALIRRATHSPLRILCTREYQNSIKDSVHKLLKDTINRLGLNGWFDSTLIGITSRAGAEFLFKGLRRDPDGIKSTEGIDIVWVEEGQNTSENSWKVLIPTIRKAGSEIWVSFNTSSEDVPTHVRFVTNTPPNTILHLVNYTENPFFGSPLKEEMEYQREVDYDAYLHIWEGMAKTISDAVILGKRCVVQDFPDDLWTESLMLF